MSNVSPSALLFVLFMSTRSSIEFVAQRKATKAPILPVPIIEISWTSSHLFDYQYRTASFLRYTVGNAA